MILAIDSATRFVSAAVYDEERDAVLASREAVGPMQHGELLAPAIESVLGEAGLAPFELTALVVGVGPGPYTGLRVGVVTARTMGFALQVPVYGLSTLDALAYGAVRAGVVEEFVVTTDARRKELFWASYGPTGARLDGPHVAKPHDVPGDRLVVGAGPGLYPDVFARTGGPIDPVAADLARLLAAEGAEIVDAEPVYLRRPDAVATADRAAAKPVS